MKMKDFLNPKAVAVGLTSKDKKSVIGELTDLLIGAGAMKAADKPEIMKILMEREELGSTGIGQGVGIPHGKSSVVKDLVASLAVSKEGVNFDSLDGEPVHIFFLLLAPEDSAGPHLKALARISRLLKDKYFRETLKNAKDAKELLSSICDEDDRRA